MNDWIEKQCTALADGAVKAIDRTRSILLITNVACVITMVSVWNAHLSWSATAERQRLLDALQSCFANGYELSPNPMSVPKSPMSPHEMVHCRELAIAFNTVTGMNFNDYNSIAVPVVGLHLDTNDMMIFGSLAIIVLQTWEWFALRRENHATRDVLALMKQSRDRQVVTYLQTVVGGAFMFLASVTDPPLEESTMALRAGTGRNPTYRSSLLARWAGPSILPRKLFALLQLLPVLTIAFAMLVWAWALDHPSWIQPSKLYWNALMEEGNGPYLRSRLAFACLSLIVVGRMTWGYMQWSASTNLMREAMSDYAGRVAAVGDVADDGSRPTTTSSSSVGPTSS
jgi:hypothetical protein